jgi:hypothetical protein
MMMSFGESLIFPIADASFVLSYMILLDKAMKKWQISFHDIILNIFNCRFL